MHGEEQKFDIANLQSVHLVLGPDRQSTSAMRQATATQGLNLCTSNENALSYPHVP